MRHIKLFENYIAENEKINLILIPLNDVNFKIEAKKDNELGITNSMSDVAIADILNRKYGKGKWFKRISVDKQKENESRKQLEEEYKNSHVKESFELREIDGEWAIIGNFSRLFGKKEELEKIIKDLNESEEKELKVEPIGIEGNEFLINVNSHTYAYSVKDDSEFSIQQIGEKFVKILKYSAGRALSWLKKHTVLTKGSLKEESLYLFIFDNLHENADYIDDMAIDMIDFYGGKLPDSYLDCEEYTQAREIDIDTLKDVYITAQMLQEEN